MHIGEKKDMHVFFASIRYAKLIGGGIIDIHVGKIAKKIDMHIGKIAKTIVGMHVGEKYVLLSDRKSVV